MENLVQLFRTVVIFIFLFQIPQNLAVKPVRQNWLIYLVFMSWKRVPEEVMSHSVAILKWKVTPGDTVGGGNFN